MTEPAMRSTLSRMAAQTSLLSAVAQYADADLRDRSSALQEVKRRALVLVEKAQAEGMEAAQTGRKLEMQRGRGLHATV